jgi:acyl-CoA thioesterase-1
MIFLLRGGLRFFPADPSAANLSGPRMSAPPYGRRGRLFHFTAAWIFATLMFSAGLRAYAAPTGPHTIHIVALGDSLTAGYQLPQDAAFPVVLEKALRADGLDVTVANAGVSGDTASDGLDRLDWSVPPGTDAVILELGANDMLRGLDPNLTRQALTTILTRLQARGIKVLLAGMLAAPQLGQDYTARFDAIYPDLAKTFNVPLYPFFLDGMAGVADLTQSDGMHPTRAGVETTVKAILPMVEAFLKNVRPQG